MATWIALLRGINVGGKNKIKMAELRAALESAGLADIQTYIQSGNIVFKSSQTAGKLQILVKTTIESGWGYDVPTMVLKANELKKIVANNPFTEGDENFLHATLLQSKPKAAAVKDTQDHDFGIDEFLVDGKCVYIYCPSGYSKTKITNGFFEKRLGVSATTRNWRTVNRLIAMIECQP